jgi:hypothetical protein
MEVYLRFDLFLLAGCLLGLIVDAEDGSSAFLRNARLASARLYGVLNPT